MKSAAEIVGAKLRSLREKAGYRLEQVGEATGIDYSWLSRLETGKKQGIDVFKLKKVAEFFGLTIDQLLDERAETSPQLPQDFVRSDEISHLERWRRLSDAARAPLEQLAELLQPAEVVSLAAHRERHRRATCTLRLVGNVAAISPTDQLMFGFAERLSDTVEVPIEHLPPRLVEKHQAAEELPSSEIIAARVRGSSMTDEDIHDADILVCTPAPLGRYHKGDRVLAWVEGRGMVVKTYAGQKSGIITLRSASETGETLTGTPEQIQVLAIIEDVWREG